MAQNNRRTIKFEKYHGAGNDFIMIKDLDKIHHLSTEQIAAMCNRRTGIGADGLIIIRQDENTDYRMHYYNADGKESTMCGNGGRCVAAFAYENEIGGLQQEFTGPDGLHHAKINSQSEGTFNVTLQLSDVRDIKDHKSFYTLNTGSPHYVTFAHNIESMDVKSQGRKIRFSSQFAPAGLNVNFTEEKSGKLFVRTYERGVEDETLSCGTGVTAAALAWAEKKQLQKGSVKIITRGGEMQVNFNRNNEIFTDIYLSGPAKRVFEGETWVLI